MLYVFILIIFNTLIVTCKYQGYVDIFSLCLAVRDTFPFVSGQISLPIVSAIGSSFKQIIQSCKFGNVPCDIMKYYFSILNKFFKWYNMHVAFSDITYHFNPFYDNCYTINEHSIYDANGTSEDEGHASLFWMLLFSLQNTNLHFQDLPYCSSLTNQKIHWWPMAWVLHWRFTIKMNWHFLKRMVLRLKLDIWQQFLFQWWSIKLNICKYTLKFGYFLDHWIFFAWQMYQ